MILLAQPAAYTEEEQEDSCCSNMALEAFDCVFFHSCLQLTLKQVLTLSQNLLDAVNS